MSDLHDFLGDVYDSVFDPTNWDSWSFLSSDTDQKTKTQSAPPPKNPFPDDAAFDAGMERLTQKRNLIKGSQRGDEKENARKREALNKEFWDSQG